MDLTPIVASPSPLHILGTWLLVVNILSIAGMGADKLMAILWNDRISERTFWFAALAGGFLGIYAGGLVFRHKVSKSEFWGPVVAATVLWIFLLTAYTAFYFNLLR